MKKVIILLFVCLFVLSGCAKEEECTVTFDTQGGSTIEQQVVVKGEKAKEPPAPTKECECEFDGWYVGDEKWSFIGYAVTEDITLTAKWVKCFDLTDKELEILKSLKIFEDKYTWRDVENVQKSDCYYENEVLDSVKYTITFKDGTTFTIDIAKSCL